MPLTDTAIRQAKAPTEKVRKLPDGKGLYLLLTVSGGKLWRYDYRFAGKRKMLALGAYPDVSLADARKRYTATREMLAAEPSMSDLSTVVHIIKMPDRTRPPGWRTMLIDLRVLPVNLPTATRDGALSL